MLTGAGDREAVALAISGGARGYLHKNVSHEELCAAVATALAETPVAARPRRARTPTPPRRAAAGADRARDAGPARHGRRAGATREIGRELYLSEDTIKTHARRLFRKLGVNDRAQAVASGFRWGLVR